MTEQDINRENVQRSLKQILEMAGSSAMESERLIIIENRCQDIWTELGGTDIDEIYPDRATESKEESDA